MRAMKQYELPKPEFEKIFRAEVILDDPYILGDIGTGSSEIVAVRGGAFEGKLNGKIMDFGGDWGLLHSDTVNVMDTKYLLKTEDDAYIAVSCKGRLIMDMETMYNNETFVDPSEYYFRNTVEFTTGAEKYKWLNNIIAFAIIMITPNGDVCLDVYELK